MRDSTPYALTRAPGPSDSKPEPELLTFDLGGTTMQVERRPDQTVAAALSRGLEDLMGGPVMVFAYPDGRTFDLRTPSGPYRVRVTFEAELEPE